MWTIYGHRCKINGKWYIGQTSHDPEMRWGKNGINYKGQIFYRAIKKFGWDNFEHIILIENISSQAEANSLETALIQKYNSIKSGYNVAPGGLNITNISPVYQLDENKNILNTFSSIAAAKDALNIYNIGHCCRNKQKTAGGYYWCYQEDFDKYEIKRPSKIPGKKQVYRLDEHKNILERFSSLREAEIKYNLNHANFIACLNMKRHCCNNMFWCYAKNYAMYKIKDKHVYTQKIDQFDKNNIFIRTWDSARQIERELSFAHSSILDCCKNKIKQSHGFIWRFNNEN